MYIFEASTFTIDWCRKCLKKLSGTDVKCADRRVVFEHKRGNLCKIATLKERTPGKHSSPKKRRIVRDEPSCSYVPGGFWVVLNIADFDF